MIVFALVWFLAHSALAVECPAGQQPNPHYGQAMYSTLTNTEDECIELSLGYSIASGEVREYQNEANSAENWATTAKRSSWPAEQDWNPLQSNGEGLYTGPATSQGACGSCVIYAMTTCYEMWFNRLRAEEGKPKIMLDHANQVNCRQKARDAVGSIYLFEFNIAPRLDLFHDGLKALYDRLAKENADKMDEGRYPSTPFWLFRDNGKVEIGVSYMPFDDVVKPHLSSASTGTDPNVRILSVSTTNKGASVCSGAYATEYLDGLYAEQQALRASDKPATATRGIFSINTMSTRVYAETRPAGSKCKESSSVSKQIGLLTPVARDDLIPPFGQSASSLGTRVWRDTYSPLRPASPEDHLKKLNSIIAALQHGAVIATVQGCQSFMKFTGAGIFDMETCMKDQAFSAHRWHRVVFTGYKIVRSSGGQIDQRRSYFIVQNSWGAFWGNKGFGKIAMSFEGSPAYGHVTLPLTRPHNSVENPLLPRFADQALKIPMDAFNDADDRWNSCSSLKLSRVSFATEDIDENMGICVMPVGDWFEASLEYKLSPFLIYKKAQIKAITTTTTMPVPGNPVIVVNIDGEIITLEGEWKRDTILNSKRQAVSVLSLTSTFDLKGKKATELSGMRFRLAYRDQDAVKTGGTSCINRSRGRCMSKSDCRAMQGGAGFSGCKLFGTDFACCAHMRKDTGSPPQLGDFFLESVQLVELDQAGSAALRGTGNTGGGAPLGAVSSAKAASLVVAATAALAATI